MLVYADNLLPSNVPTPIFDEDRHQTFYGFGFMSDGTPLICDNATRTLRKISINGIVDTVYQSPENWHPIGVYTTKENYYVMESGWSQTHMGPRIIILDKQFQKVKLLDIEMDKKLITTTLFNTQSETVNKKKQGSIPVYILAGIIVILAAIAIRKKLAN